MAWYWIVLIILMWIEGIVLTGALMFFADRYPFIPKLLVIIFWPIGLPIFVAYVKLFG